MKTFSKKLSKNWNILGGTTGKELHITPAVSFTYDDSIFKTPKLFIMWLHWGLVLYRKPEKPIDFSDPNSILEAYSEVDYIENGEIILHDMREIIDRYGECTFSDYIDLRKCYDLPIVENEHRFLKYGWKNLTNSSVSRLDGRVFLVLPSLETLYA